MTGTPWEPPLAGSDETQLIGALERLRTTFRWKADGLDAAGLGQRAARSKLTLGGLLKHLALVEDYMFTVKNDGTPLSEPWAEIDWAADPEWEFTTAAWTSASRRAGTGNTPACGAWCSTWSRSTGGIPGTRTCSARPSTA